MSTQPRREPDRQPDRQPGNGAGNGPGNGPGSGPRRGPRSGSRRPLRPTRVAALVVVVLLILEVLAIRFVALQIGGGLTFLLLVAILQIGHRARLGSLVAKDRVDQRGHYVLNKPLRVADFRDHERSVLGLYAKDDADLKLHRETVL